MEHGAAVRLASAANYGPAQSADSSGAPDSAAQVLRVTASPYPGNPYRWHTVVELSLIHIFLVEGGLEGTGV